MANLRITAACIGPNQFGRVALVNQNGEFWTGNGWAADRRRALLYPSLQSTGDELSKIYLGHSDGPVRRFRVPMTFHLIGGEDVLIHDYKLWLRKAMVFQVADGQGFGPSEGSVSLGSLDVQRMKEIASDRK